MVHHHPASLRGHVTVTLGQRIVPHGGRLVALPNKSGPSSSPPAFPLRASLTAAAGPARPERPRRAEPPASRACLFVVESAVSEYILDLTLVGDRGAHSLWSSCGSLFGHHSLTMIYGGLSAGYATESDEYSSQCQPWEALVQLTALVPHSIIIVIKLEEVDKCG